jgi:integrase
MRARHRPSGVHYYLDSGERPRKEIPLGKDYVAAVQKWAEHTSKKAPARAAATFKHVSDLYLRDVLHTKASSTQGKNLTELANLLKFFGDPPVEFESIEPVHVRQYLDWRWTSSVQAKKDSNAERLRDGKVALDVTGKEGQVPANREKALLSHIWNYARNKGLTKLPNPCAGIKGFRENGRDVYIEDTLYALVQRFAEQPLIDALDLAYLTGQRPADVLKMTYADVKDGAIWIKQNKTRTKLRVAIEGELAALMERLKLRKIRSIALINDMTGTPLTKYQLRGAFDRARDAAVAACPVLEVEIRNFQFRDLRAKAGTDTEDALGIGAAQAQLGHSTAEMTAHYVRHRRGKLVKPTK